MKLQGLCASFQIAVKHRQRCAFLLSFVAIACVNFSSPHCHFSLGVASSPGKFVERTLRVRACLAATPNGQYFMAVQVGGDKHVFSRRVDTVVMFWGL